MAATDDAFTPCRVTRIVEEAEGIRSFLLERIDGEAMPEWVPGAHIEVLTGDGDIRHYSLTSAPDDRRQWRITVAKDRRGRGGSRFLHEDVTAFTRLQCRGPHGRFALRPGGPVLFIAGGIGITPFLSMIAEAERAGRDWQLLYLAKSWNSLAFADDLRGFGARVTFCISSESGSRPLDERLHGSHLSSWASAERPDVYVCGPERLSADVHRYFEPLHVPVHEEKFSSQGVPSYPEEGTPFVVETGDGTEISVGADESVLEALERNGIRTLSSCREGHCGTCETPVLDGIPDHRDIILDASEKAENTCMMICVSRSLTPRLVLEV